MTTDESTLGLINETTVGTELTSLSTTTLDDGWVYANESIRYNCSVYNPCGRNGYCRNNLDGEWKCLCKFWWNGTTCHELTSSGKQVIALGVMLGVIIALFYGLAISHMIRKRREQTSNDDSRENPSIIKRTFPVIPINALRPSHRLTSWITGILTILIATSGLLTKWSIIKPIHEEIVNKFHNQEPVFFKPHSICRIIDLTAYFNLFTFPVACLLILLLIIITKRVSFQRNKWFKGYIGLPIPLDFFAHVKRTLAAVIFAIFADELLEIASDAITGNKRIKADGVILTYLVQILRVFIIGFRRYPILAAVYIDNCFSLICATFYIWLDYSISIVYSGLCRNDFYITEDDYNKEPSNSTIVELNYYGTGSKIIFLQLFPDIPRYLCMAYISVKLPVLLIKRIRERKSIDRRLTREQKNLLYSSLPYSAESRYVKRLLNINKPKAPSNRFMNIFRHIYQWRDDFRFSSRVVCVYASVFLMLFFITVQACVELIPYLQDLQDTCQEIVDQLSSIGSSDDSEYLEESTQSDFPLPNFVRPFLLAVMVTLFIIVFQLLVMLAGIRRNLFQAFRGDASEIPRNVASNNISYITGNFHFAGYLIGYVIVGYILLLFISLILLLAIDAFITFGSVKFLETILKGLIPFILFIVFKIYLNKFLGRYIFLQHHGEVLSINNRRAFMVFLYFNFFLDAFVGLAAAIMRIIKSIFGGLIYMCRLDYSPLGRKLETMDAGFNAYCGFIRMECAHRHPVLLCFASHLLRNYLYPTEIRRVSRAKHKWRLAVFLLNNPVLIYRRKGFLSRIQANDVTMMLVGKNHIDDIYIEQRTTLSHRPSIISEKELEDLWERRRF